MQLAGIEKDKITFVELNFLFTGAKEGRSIQNVTKFKVTMNMGFTILKIYKKNF